MTKTQIDKEFEQLCRELQPEHRIKVLLRAIAKGDIEQMKRIDNPSSNLMGMQGYRQLQLYKTKSLQIAAFFKEFAFYYSVQMLRFRLEVENSLRIGGLNDSLMWLRMYKDTCTSLTAEQKEELSKRGKDDDSIPAEDGLDSMSKRYEELSAHYGEHADQKLALSEELDESIDGLFISSRSLLEEWEGFRIFCNGIGIEPREIFAMTGNISAKILADMLELAESIISAVGRKVSEVLDPGNVELAKQRYERMWPS